MRTFMGARHRAHCGRMGLKARLGLIVGRHQRSWSSLRCLIGLFSELGPHLRHRDPQRPHVLVSRLVRALAAIRSLLPTLCRSGKAVHELPRPRIGSREHLAGLERRQGSLAHATPIDAQWRCRKERGCGRARHPLHVTGSQQANTSPKISGRNSQPSD